MLQITQPLKRSIEVGINSDLQGDKQCIENAQISTLFSELILRANSSLKIMHLTPSVENGILRIAIALAIAALISNAIVTPIMSILTLLKAFSSSKTKKIF